MRVLRQWTQGRIAVYAALPSRRFVPLRVQAFLDFITSQTRRSLDKLEQK